MTDFHEVFMVKINKMIKKKTGGNFLVICVFMLALCIQIATKLCLIYSPDSWLHTIYTTFKR